jgi:hypothetical protein
MGMSDVVKHEETRTEAAPTWNYLFGVEIVSRCLCGARWWHPLNRSDEEKDAIFASHVKYFERMTVVL